jgi:diguanylate cyclase (GGDEF)-like protein
MVPAWVPRCLRRRFFLVCATAVSLQAFRGPLNLSISVLMARGPLRRMSLLGKFSLLACACLLALGVALGHVLGEQIRQHALDEAEAATEAAAHIVTKSQLAPYDLSVGLSPARMAELDYELKADRGERTIERAKIFNRRGHIVYSDDRGEVGDVGDEGEESEGLRTALAGRVASDVEEAEAGETNTHEELLEVYVPLRFRQSGQPAGAFELYLSYAPTAAEIRHEQRVAFTILGGGLLLLFLVLFRVVAGASRTMRRQAELNSHQALHDALTGLPNRTLLYQRGEELLKWSEEPTLAVLLVDLDRFKEVNDTLGHDCGDQILRDVAERMLREVRSQDTLARLGGDELALLLPDVGSATAAREAAGRILTALERPFSIRGFSVQLEASIGMALAPVHGHDIKHLLQRADVAMYEAKRNRSGIELYSFDRDPYTPERLTLLGDLKEAIEQDQLVLHFQPQVSLETGKLTGAEALLRWQHPERGLLMPDEFVHLAERTAQIRGLTLWVVKTALRECRRWSDAGLDLNVAVNLAGPNVTDGSLPSAVQDMLDRCDVSPQCLELEISESTVMTDSARAEDVLARFGAIGVRLSLDDFGTGHSSLGYLRRLPLDRVKIDRSFVMGMTREEEDAEIVRWTIDLARSLGLEAVAEGVESAEIQAALSALGCPSAQGYYISRPVPADDFLSWALAQSLDRVLDDVALRSEAPQRHVVGEAR